MPSTANAREQALPPGVQLEGYEITRVLGVGGFGVTYEADDSTLSRKVAIKEYFPGSLAVREKDGRTISARADEGSDFFEYGLRRFLDEARTLAQFHHPNIVHVNRYLEANGTAYLVMDYEEGESLEDRLQQRRRLAVDELHPILVSVLQGLKTVHARSYLHRDIKPDNIFLRREGPPLLLDFGSARQALEHQRQSMTVVLTPGYAPIEQYAESDQQGPYSDLYSVGATMFRCLLGRHPPESTARVSALHNGDEDPALQQIRDSFGEQSAQFCKLLEWMMQLRVRERPQTAEHVLDVLDHVDTQSPELSEAPTEYAASVRCAPVEHVPTVELRPATASEFCATETQLAAVATLMAESVGPIARILVKKAAKSAENTDGFIVRLESELESDAERENFVSKARALLSSS